MEQALTIESHEADGCLNVSVTGRIDSYHADQLERFVEEKVHAGCYHLVFDLAGANYISSTGIRVFVKYFKKLHTLNGSLSIASTSAEVKQVMVMAGLETFFDGRQGRKQPAAKTGDWSMNEGDTSIRFVTLNVDSVFDLNLYGNPGVLADPAGEPFRSATIEFTGNMLGLGLGAMGSGTGHSSGRYGEFLSAASSVVVQPTDSNHTDYLTSTGSLVPAVQMVYGAVAGGDFSHAVQFSCSGKGTLPLSRLLGIIGEELKTGCFMVAMIAESHGLVGAALKKSPDTLPQGASMFSFPEVRQQVWFTTDPAFSGNLALCVGMVDGQSHAELTKFTRPLGQGGKLRGHIHAAVFPFHLLRKDDFGFNRISAELFETSAPVQVMHLLNDNRAITGNGESEFRQGICWIGKIDTSSIKTVMP